MKKFIVIEKAEGHYDLYGVKIFDSFYDAKKHFNEAVEMFQLDSSLGKIEILEEWKKEE